MIEVMDRSGLKSTSVGKGKRRCGVGGLEAICRQHAEINAEAMDGGVEVLM